MGTETGKEVVVIGVHTPEFAFEQDVENVRRALRQLRITYPVVIDNDYTIWRAFENQYWPVVYFLDARGRVRQHHFGEASTNSPKGPFSGLLAEALGAGFRNSEVVSVEPAGVEAPADWAN